MKAFISYSHADSEYLTQLNTHLAQLRRTDLIKEWTDHDIDAGGDIDSEVIRQLESSKLFIALVSPDYIASKYCFDREFEKAMQLKNAGKLTIVPIICRPCDWKETPFKDFLAIPKDGIAISTWASRDSAFFDITSKLRKLLSDDLIPENPRERFVDIAKKPKNSRYQVSKDFDKIEKIVFLEKSFIVIVKKLMAYLDEISSLENVKFKILKDSETNFKCMLVNRDKGIAQAEMSLLKSDEIDGRAFNGYLNGDLTAILQSENNEIRLPFVLTSDDYEQFFEKHDMMRQNEREKYYAEGIADYLWREWLKNIGISMD